MKRNPPTAREDDRLETAQTRMAWAGLHHLLVVRGDRTIGVLSERDLAAHRAVDGNWRSAPVRAAMHVSASFAFPDESTAEVAARMAAARLSAMPVLDGGSLVGLVTASEVGRAPDAAEPAERCVRHVMTASPVTIQAGAPLADAAARMADQHIRHLPVVGPSGNLVGMLSDRDVRTALGIARGSGAHGPAGRPSPLVRDAMSSAPLCALAHEPIAAVARLFVDARLSALPVVDRDDRLVGILSYVDVLRELAG